jgi:hypothetical protein
MPVRLSLSCLLLLGALLAPASARADQLEWNTLADAKAALQVVEKVRVVRHFCRPCGETVSTPARVESVEISEVPGGTERDGWGRDVQYWEVLVNGEAVDLAYVYVPHGGRWLNLAILLDIGASDVPTTLSVDQVPGGHAVDAR